MNAARDFHAGDLISVTTGILLSPTGMSGLHELIEHLADGPVWTTGLMLIADRATPHLEAQHPWLRGLAPPKGELQDLARWFADVVADHGAMHAVTPLPADQQEPPDPLLGIPAGRPVIPVYLGVTR